LDLQWQQARLWWPIDLRCQDAIIAGIANAAGQRTAFLLKIDDAPALRVAWLIAAVRVLFVLFVLGLVAVIFMLKSA